MPFLLKTLVVFAPLVLTVKRWNSPAARPAEAGAYFSGGLGITGVN